MPTGYTSYINDGEITSGKEFLKLCTRAFGIAVDLKDESLDVPTPNHFEPDPYYEKAYKDSLKSRDKTYHMTFEEAATLAKKAEVDQLLLTHFGAAMTDPADYKENATSIFEQTIIGEDHYSIQLNFKD